MNVFYRIKRYIERYVGSLIHTSVAPTPAPSGAAGACHACDRLSPKNHLSWWRKVLPCFGMGGEGAIENSHRSRARGLLMWSVKGSNLRLRVIATRIGWHKGSPLRQPPNGSNLLLPGWRDIHLSPPNPTARAFCPPSTPVTSATGVSFLGGQLIRQGSQRKRDDMWKATLSAMTHRLPPFSHCRKQLWMTPTGVFCDRAPGWSERGLLP